MCRNERSIQYELPQIVVVGSQSAGKILVLVNIVEEYTYKYVLELRLIKN